MSKPDLITRATEIAQAPHAYANSVVSELIGELLAENSIRDDLHKALIAERDEARNRLHKMHRRAQKSEGKMQRSLTLLEHIIARVERSITPYGKPAAEPLDSPRLHYNLCAVRDHAKAASGRAQAVFWSYYGKLYHEQKARAEAAEAEAASLKAEVARLRKWLAVPPAPEPNEIALAYYDRLCDMNTKRLLFDTKGAALRSNVAEVEGDIHGLALAVPLLRLWDLYEVQRNPQGAADAFQQLATNIERAALRAKKEGE